MMEQVMEPSPAPQHITCHGAPRVAAPCLARSQLPQGIALTSVQPGNATTVEHALEPFRAGSSSTTYLSIRAGLHYQSAGVQEALPP